MRRNWRYAGLLIVVFLLSACMALPAAGPSSPAYVGDGKTMAEFYQADNYCRTIAHQRTGITPGEAATQSTIGSSIFGTLLGAALGAAIGAAGGDAGMGAAIGAGAGLAGGAATGSATGAASAGAVQHRYDIEYQQCMYAAGHKVPGMATMQAPPQQSIPPPPPPPQYAPPPPPPPSGGQSCRPSGKYVQMRDGSVVQLCE